MSKNFVESILKEYPMLKSRISLIEKVCENKEQYNHGCVRNKTTSTSKGECISRNRVQKQNAMINHLVDNVEDMEKELTGLYKSIDIVDEALNILKNINEDYYKMANEHFIKDVRVEDLEDVFGLSRSRCYELRKRSIEELSGIIFGKVQ